MLEIFMRNLRWVSIIGVLVLIGGAVFYWIFPTKDCSQPLEGQPAEVEVTRIALADPLDRRSAEISGMDWYGDYLIILPQYFNHAVGRVVYAIPKSEILDYLAGPDPEPIQAIRIPVADQLFGEELGKGFEGYEAIAVAGDRIFLTVEISSRKVMSGLLVPGRIEPDLSRVVLETERRQSIPLQQQIENLADETLVSAGERLIAIYEANGAADNPTPVAHIFDQNLQLVSELPFPTIEYRVTDATDLDTENNFWVLNTYSLGTFGLKPQVDAIAQTYGEGCTHSFYFGVERLVELHYDPTDGITLTSRAPIQLALLGNLFSRNWEGVARLDDLGFLIASDKYPETILGFVPFP
jgi:hypothetical protein